MHSNVPVFCACLLIHGNTRGQATYADQHCNIASLNARFRDFQIKQRVITFLLCFAVLTHQHAACNFNYPERSHNTLAGMPMMMMMLIMLMIFMLIY